MNGPDFVRMGPAHITALVLIVVVPALMSLAVRRSWLGSNTRMILACAFAAVMLTNDVCIRIFMLSTGKSINVSLPLHLCDVAVYITVGAIFMRSLGLYEVAYFWGFAGTVQALLTPELNHGEGFPSFRYFSFFIGHGGVLVGVLYMTWGLNMRPEFWSIWRVFLWCQVYLFFNLIVNYTLGSNYGFTMAKPETGSILDYMGPWPWYLVGMQVVGVAMFVIYYLPFLYSDWAGLQPLLGRNARPLPGRPLEEPPDIWKEIEDETA
ncbi:MAG: TIGR02206 family membrane protein [Candidatus Methylacidiphilales bacterium]|nr:TIGR02206 family membrane protein [Candidatus Methylacidiphilales bacterium]